MFNKPTIFNRNEPPAKRETSTPPGSSNRQVIQTLGPGQGRTATPMSKENLTQANTQGGAAQDSAALAKDAIDAQAEKPMGARLIVGPDVKLKGAEILDCDTLVVEGRVEATMDSRVIRIAENGSFSGKVSIDIAEIHGCFEGDLTARSQLIIHSTGRVKGTVRYGKLVADEGCELCGDISTLSTSPAERNRATPEPFLALNAAAG